jgi:MCM P-loop domain
MGNRCGGTLTSRASADDDSFEMGEIKGEMSFSPTHLAQIRTIAERFSERFASDGTNPRPYALVSLLVDSLCPEICGHELVKLGMLLTMCGGAQMPDVDMPTRSNIHMLGGDCFAHTIFRNC